MIITRAPLRISFVGGGSDRPSFSNEEEGACVAASIDKYVYVTLTHKYDGRVQVSYSTSENVEKSEQLKHELVRACLRLCAVEGVEIHSIADIPGGTGLGSSSTFTVALLQALDAMDFQHNASPQWLARTACRVELELCHKAIGRQDQYATAFGGLNEYRFRPDGRVTISPIEYDKWTLSKHCLLLDTGLRRQEDAGRLLISQEHNRDDVRALVKLVDPFIRALIAGDFSTCGEVLHEAWQIKRHQINDMTIDSWYNTARACGAWGGKLCGAGGGGFLLFMAPREFHGRITASLGLRPVPIQVGVPGSSIVYST